MLKLITDLSTAYGPPGRSPAWSPPAQPHHHTLLLATGDQPGVGHSPSGSGMQSRPHPPQLPQES